MALDLESATDSILSQLKVAWDAGSAAIAGAVPTLVYDSTERDLKPHPSDETAAWARHVVRHSDSRKATLAGPDGKGRYRRLGITWVQIFVPFTGASSWTVAQKLAEVAQTAYEGKRGASGEIVYIKATTLEKAPEGTWCRYDVKVEFYWDEVKR